MSNDEGEKQKDALLGWLNANTAIALAVVALVFIGVKLLILSHGNPTSALAMASNAQAGSLILGTVLVNIVVFSSAVFLLSATWLARAIVARSGDLLQVGVIAVAALFISGFLLPSPEQVIEWPDLNGWLAVFSIVLVLSVLALLIAVTVMTLNGSDDDRTRVLEELRLTEPDLGAPFHVVQLARLDETVGEFLRPSRKAKRVDWDQVGESAHAEALETVGEALESLEEVEPLPELNTLLTTLDRGSKTGKDLIAGDLKETKLAMRGIRSRASDSDVVPDEWIAVEDHLRYVRTMLERTIDDATELEKQQSERMPVWFVTAMVALSALAVVLVVTFTFLNDDVWLPSEVIVVDGERVAGYVIDENDNSLVILSEETRTVSRFTVDDVESRTPCQLETAQRTVWDWLFGEDAAAPDC